MNWLNRLERKFGRYALQNLPLYIALLYGAGVVLNIVTNGMWYTYCSLNPYYILHGQPWRILTFLAAPSDTSIISLIFCLFFYYSIGQSLVQVWGAFRFNMYMLVGVLANIAAAFIVYAIYASPFIFMDTTYLNLSIFLAYAAIFPEMQVYFWGILPIKVKWFAWIEVALLAWDFVQGSMGSRIAIVVSLLNFVLFYVSSRNYKKVSPQEFKRKQAYRKSVKSARSARSSAKGSAGAYRHKCAVCGRTELDDPNLEFRYCSKCNGNYEYCNDHLFTHTHVK